MKRMFMGKKRQLVVHITRLTSSSNVTVGDDWVSMDLFLVGGGGSGGSWYTWGWAPGGGGAGGECVTIKDIPVVAGTTISVSVGAGGAGVSIRSTKSGNTGGSTTVTYNGATYTARGGKPGTAGGQGSYDYISTGGEGYDKRSDAIGYEETSDTVFTVYNKHNEVLGLIENYAWNTTYTYNVGVPEFHEEGNPTHAGGGGSQCWLKPQTSFADNKGGDFDNSSESIYMYGGGGYGGGGAGGYYRYGLTGAGGNGGVVIRYYTYE